MQNKKVIFFGTPTIAAIALKELIQGGLVPSLIVTGPEKPQGRGMELTPTPVAVIAQRENIPYITPNKITSEVITDIMHKGSWDAGIVVAYGKILPQALLDALGGKIINIHPSLLPKHRGPSPLSSVLLSDDEQTGVTIMEIDALVDHGPIIAQKTFSLPKEITFPELEEISAITGAHMILETIDSYLNGSLEVKEQDHTQSTHTKKVQKEDGNLDILSSEWEKWKHYRAFIGWPGTFFTVQYRNKPLRVKVRKAHWDATFVIDEVTPENQKPLPYDVFEKWLLS